MFGPIVQQISRTPDLRDGRLKSPLDNLVQQSEDLDQVAFPRTVRPDQEIQSTEVKRHLANRLESRDLDTVQGFGGRHVYQPLDSHSTMSRRERTFAQRSQHSPPGSMVPLYRISKAFSFAPMRRLLFGVTSDFVA